MYLKENNPIKGYKCFNKGLTNRYGMKFEVGKLYHQENNIIYGINGNGYHMCKRLEDTLRFFDVMDNEVDICKVNGYGNVEERNDTYNDYYEMYAVEYLYIDTLLKRKEIIDYALNLNELIVLRFISQFRLTEAEQNIFYQQFHNNNQVISYLENYQKNNRDVFIKKLVKP